MPCPNEDHNIHRENLPGMTDAGVESELHRAWEPTWGGKPWHKGPPYNSAHHNWTFFRAITLREARKRGLDISITGLGT